MVSVIIPAFNCEKFIAQCICSIVVQPYADLEVIIIDDGSTDSSAAIIDEHALNDTRIKVFHVENGGPSKARNIGLEHASGEWVMFVDADDWIDDDLFTSLSLSNTSADIIYWGFKKCMQDGTLLEVCKPDSFSCSVSKESYFQQLTELLLSKLQFFGFSWNKVFKRSIIEKHNIRFEEDLSIREDEVFTLRYCLYAQVVETLSFAPYNYRILSNSLSHDAEIKYRNFFRLAQVEQLLLKDYSQSMFRNAFLNKVFNFYISAIIECVKFSKPEKQHAIEESIRLYDSSASYIVAPSWVKCLYRLPVKPLRKYIVNTVFYVRNQFK